MSRRRVSAFDAPGVAAWRLLGSSSPTCSHVIPGRQIAWRGMLEFIVSRNILPLTLRYEPNLPSSRQSADFPSMRNSGSRYLLHNAGGSTTCESLSKTANRLFAIVKLRCVLQRLRV